MTFSEIFDGKDLVRIDCDGYEHVFAYKFINEGKYSVKLPLRPSWNACYRKVDGDSVVFEYWFSGDKPDVMRWLGRMYGWAITGKSPFVDVRNGNLPYKWRLYWENNRNVEVIGGMSCCWYFSCGCYVSMSTDACDRYSSSLTYYTSFYEVGRLEEERDHWFSGDEAFGDMANRFIHSGEFKEHLAYMKRRYGSSVFII